MPSTLFIPGQTSVNADWLNDVNSLVYNGTFPGGGGSGILTNIGAINAVGLIAVTNATTGTVSPVTLIAGSGVTITNGNGVSGNPTITVSGASGGSTITITGASSGSLSVTTAAAAGSSALALKVAGNGTAVMTFPATTDTVAVPGSASTWTANQSYGQGNFLLKGSSTGSTTINSSLSGGSSNTLTLPSGTDTLAGLSTAQTWGALQKYPVGDLALLGSSTGYTLLESSLSGAGNNTLMLPTTSSDTLAALGTAQTWSAVQTFTQSDVRLLGSSTGYTTLNSGLSSSSNNTLTLPTTASDSLAGLATAQTWTAVQTMTKSDFKLLGSSTGATTLNSGLSGGSNNTLTLPTTAADTLAGLGTAQTWTAVQTVTNGDFKLLGTSTGATTLNSGLVSSGNSTLTLPATAADTLAGIGTVQTWTAAQTFTDGDMLLKGSSSGALTLKAPAAASGYVATFPANSGTVYVSGDGAANPVLVSDGGTGLATLTTAYGILCAGTTATGNVQTLSNGSATQVLTSNGNGSLPSWQNAGGNSSPSIGVGYLISSGQFV